MVTLNEKEREAKQEVDAKIKDQMSQMERFNEAKANTERLLNQSSQF